MIGLPLQHRFSYISISDILSTCSARLTVVVCGLHTYQIKNQCETNQALNGLSLLNPVDTVEHKHVR